MEDKKTIIKTIIVTAVVSSFLTGMVIGTVLSILGKSGNQNPGPNSGSTQNPAQPVSAPWSGASPSSTPNPIVPSSDNAVISDKTKIPNIVTGTVSSVGNDKVVIKQFVSTDISYEINKSDISSITKLKKNPSFNEEKAKQKQQEIAEKMKSLGLNSPSQQQNLDPQKQEEMRKITEELNQEMAKDPSLKPFIEENASFAEIKQGQQVNFFKENNSSQGKLSIYPENMNIGPPKQ